MLTGVMDTGLVMLEEMAFGSGVVDPVELLGVGEALYENERLTQSRSVQP